MNFDDEASVATLEKPAPLPVKTPNPPKAMDDWDDEPEAPTGFKKHRLTIILGSLALVGVGFAAKVLNKASDGPALPPAPPMQVKLVLPPTPPPPPPPPQPKQELPKEEKMIEEVKPEEAPPEPSPSMETALKGPGNGPGMVLKQGNGSGIFGGRGGVANPRQQWSSYASKVKGRIEDALRMNPKTRSKVFNGKLQVWTDSTGRVTRIAVSEFGGDPAVEAAINEEIARNIQVDGRPEGMPASIYMRVGAARPK